MHTSYKKLAVIYDSVMVHVDYMQWFKYISKIDKKYHIPSNDVLELGGGTGNLAELFIGTKWDWCLTDYSFDMINQARLKLGFADLDMVVQDSRNIALKKRFGLAVFLYDGINYLLKKKDLVSCFKSVHKSLLSGGYFLFDVTTEFNSKENFLDYTYYEDMETHIYVRNSFYDIKNRNQYNIFNIFEKCSDGRYKKTEDSHVQKVYKASDIAKLVEKESFKIIGIWDGFGFSKASSQSKRIHFLVQKI